MFSTVELERLHLFWKDCISASISASSRKHYNLQLRNKYHCPTIEIFFFKVEFSRQEAPVGKSDNKQVSHARRFV